MFSCEFCVLVDTDSDSHGEPNARLMWKLSCTSQEWQISHVSHLLNQGKLGQYSIVATTEVEVLRLAPLHRQGYDEGEIICICTQGTKDLWHDSVT